MIKGVLFDFIGTIVMEKDPLLINRCFSHAFKDHKVAVTDEFIKANRGKDKKEVITEALQQNDLPAELTDAIASSLKKYIESNLDNFYENEGAKETIHCLKQKGITIGVGSGLPRDTFEKIFFHLGWQTVGFDYIGIAAEMPRGRPYPDMILDMLQRHRLATGELMKVGDTVADIQEGKNAHVLTAAILSGTQDEKEIIAQQPDYIIRSLAELKVIVQ